MNSVKGRSTSSPATACCRSERRKREKQAIPRVPRDDPREKVLNPRIPRVTSYLCVIRTHAHEKVVGPCGGRGVMRGNWPMPRIRPVPPPAAASQLLTHYHRNPFD